MFSELGTAETRPAPAIRNRRYSTSCRDSRSPKGSTPSPTTSEQIAATVFEIAAADIGLDDALDEIGLDSLMAMDFRVRVNAMFAIDLPLLEILRGVSVRFGGRSNPRRSSIGGTTGRGVKQRPDDQRRRRRVDGLIDQLSDAELREILAELERQPAGRENGRRIRESRGARPAFIQVLRASQAVRDFDLDVGYGEIFAILGPNGAGKSTTIEILEGHRKRDSGDVSVLGEDPGTAGRAWRAKIGIVLQEVSDAGMLTVSETVRMFAKC